ncbi:ubiquitin-protein ligase E3C-like [Tachysurus ichikawai]
MQIQCERPNTRKKYSLINDQKPNNELVNERILKDFFAFFLLHGLLGFARYVSEDRHLAILNELLFVVPFKERVKMFQRLTYADKRDVKWCDSFINITIRMNYIYEDAYDKLSPENEPNLKKRIRVQLLNDHGQEEVRIARGTTCCEFFSELLKSGFNPNQGFFRTTDEGLLYPSPAAEMLIGESFTRHYYFLGRILGKALYENMLDMLVELPFASFFLAKLLGTSTDVDIHHLSSLDPEMYRNLLFLKSYEGDMEDLGLNFTIVNNDLGEAQVVELKPGGNDIPVTTANRIAYIHLVADYRLNKQIRAHCLAFRQGLAEVLNLEWLRMFDQQEIQDLISGAHVLICLDDLKKFTNYSGGYFPTHPVIKIFWDVVENFSNEEKRMLLKFVTGFSRPPVLGFKEVHQREACSLAFTSGNETEYKAAKYGLRKAITAAKRQYREKLDSFYSNAVADYRTTPSTNFNSSDSLLDDLNTFYACFETSSTDTKRRHTHSAHPTNLPAPYCLIS